MPEFWTATRIAGRLHRTVLAPLGFERRGTSSTRVDGGLERSIRFYGLTALPLPAPPQVQMIVSVTLAGLPEAVTEYRRDCLWGWPQTASGYLYPRPRSDEDLRDDLVADVSGPAVEFLLRATKLDEFVLWAQEIYQGDPHRGWWGRFRPVFPQGSAPLQAAAFAAALAGDGAGCDRLADRVVALERDDDRERDDFQRELHRVHPRPALDTTNP